MVRTEIRRLSKTGSSNILRSLPACSSVRENLEILNRYLERLVQGNSLYMKIKGMPEILLYLISLVPSCINDDNITKHNNKGLLLGTFLFKERMTSLIPTFLPWGFHIQRSKIPENIVAPIIWIEGCYIHWCQTQKVYHTVS